MPIVGAPKEFKMDKVRIGIIGLGNIGQVHVGNLMDGKVPRGELTAVGDAIVDKLPDYEAKGVKIFDSGEALIASGEIDALIIATPHFQHTTLGIAALEAGFISTGIDPDREAVAHAKKHYPGPTYAVSNLTEFASRCEQKYDAIYCSEVLEHVPDANEFMASLAKLMTPRAVLYLTTPDIGHWRRPKILTEWDVFTPPRHCLFFSFGNLQDLFARHGLTIRHRQWAFKPGLKVLVEKFDALN